MVGASRCHPSQSVSLCAGPTLRTHLWGLVSQPSLCSVDAQSKFIAKTVKCLLYACSPAPAAPQSATEAVQAVFQVQTVGEFLVSNLRLLLY